MKLVGTFFVAIFVAASAVEVADTAEGLGRFIDTCEEGWKLYKGNCYSFENKQYLDAKTWCDNFGAIVFNERDAVDFMITEINRISKPEQGLRNTWSLGFTYKDGKFYFGDGAEVDVLWQEGYPHDAFSDQCVVISDKGFNGVINKWWNIPCNEYGDGRNYICQKPAMATPMGNLRRQRGRGRRKGTSNKRRTRPGNKPINKPRTRPGNRPFNKRHTRPGNRPFNDRRARPGNRPSKRPNNRPVKRTSKRPSNRPVKRTSKRPSTGQGNTGGGIFGKLPSIGDSLTSGWGNNLITGIGYRPISRPKPQQEYYYNGGDQYAQDDQDDQYAQDDQYEY